MARLEIIEGYHQGKILDVEGATTLGRAPNNTLCLYDGRASRQHAIIRSAPDGGQIISDLGSGNGTFVNNTKLEIGEPRPLKNGDLVSIGSTRILFIDEELKPEERPQRPNPSPATAILMNDSSLSVVMKAGDKGTQEIGATLDASLDFMQAQEEERSTLTIQRLQAMVQMSNELGEVAEQGALLDRVMDKIFDLFPQADRAFILMRNQDSGDMVPAIGRNRNTKPDKQDEVAISNTVINMVVEEKQSVLSTDAMKDFGEQQSIMDMSIRSMMCVPLICQNEILGVINIDTMRSSKAFNRDDLCLFTGIASQAATALKNAALFDQVESEIQMRSQLSRYMSPDVAKGISDGTISAELGGKRVHGTVLFCDIVGFTTLSEDLEATKLMDTLNRYFKITTDIIARNSGTLNKFGGDMIMAFWNVMFPDHQPELHALTTALQMQAAVWYFDLDLKAEQCPPIYMGVGINSGTFAAGNIGGERVEYTVIGDDVNLGQRIESLAGRWQVFAAESTYEPAANLCCAIGLPSCMVKGKSDPVQIYSVRGLKTGMNRMILNIPVRLLDKSGNILGEGLISGCEGTGTHQSLYFATEAVVVAGQTVTLLLDLPELETSWEIAGVIEDENRHTYYGQAVFSKSILGKLEASEDVLAFLQPGAMVESQKGWDEINRQ